MLATAGVPFPAHSGDSPMSPTNYANAQPPDPMVQPVPPAKPPRPTQRKPPEPPTVIRGADCAQCNHSGVTIIRGGAHPSITENPVR